MGPTASGKSRIALALHDALPVALVSVDSSQVYRGMDIGTAKPTPAEQARVPHRLIDIRDPSEPYSAAEFCADAMQEIDDIIRAGKIPLLVGGTIFYFRALEYGLSDLPSADAGLRDKLHAEAKSVGWPTLHKRLAASDPVAAARINPHDSQRIQRALEIVALTGAPISAAPQLAQAAYRFIKIALFPADRAALHARIATRFHTMLERGFVNEVEGLYRRHDLHSALPSIRTVGYRQIWNYLTGIGNYNQMTENAIAATRQLAKRQLTWLRRYAGVHCVDGDEEQMWMAVVNFIEKQAVINRGTGHTGR